MVWHFQNWSVLLCLIRNQIVSLCNFCKSKAGLKLEVKENKKANKNMAEIISVCCDMKPLWSVVRQEGVIGLHNSGEAGSCLQMPLVNNTILVLYNEGHLEPKIILL